MISCFGVVRRGVKRLNPLAAFTLAISGLSLVGALGGCAADVTRFDSSSFNLNDPPAETASAPAPQDSSGYDSPVASSTPRGPYGAGAKSVEVAALPDAPQSPPPSYGAYGSTPPPSSAPPPSYTPKAFGKTRPSQPYAAMPKHNIPVAKGEMIEVKPGDTLYRLSRTNHVSVSELMQVNSMTSPNLKPGQKIYLPASSGMASAAPPPSSSSVAAARAVEAATPDPAPITPVSPEVAARYGGTYTVKPGESLYTIAKNHKVLFSELQRVNGISDPRRVKPGTVLKVPGSGDTSTPVASTTAPPAAEATASEPAHYGAATSTQPSVINGEKKMAALNDRANDASPPSKPDVTDSVKLRWPATGKVIAGFGGRPDGTHNDGINVSVPLGTDVHAAESGVVAYAGSELKGYGNLVLLRHDNGWVTAYAHNDELLVKRGDKVTRGQVIAKAGKTGSVDQPQVHFELRQGSKPVDPVPYLEKS